MQVDLTVQRAELVDPALRADLYELCTLAYGTSADGQRVAAGLPQELASLSAGALLEITSLAAGIVDPELRFSFRARTHLGEQQQVVSAHAEAWTLLKGYPDSLGTLAARLGGANATPQARAARGRIRNILDGHARGELLPAVQCLADALRTSDSLNLDRQGDADMRVKPAAWILGATEGEVAAARDAKVLKSRFGFRHGALRSSLDREEIEYLGAVRVDRLAAHSLAGELGLPRYGGEQLLSTATVRRHDHPWLLARYRSAQTTHSDLAAFKASLRNSQVQAEIENPVPLACLMRRIGGGPKPWGTVLGMMAQARLPFRLKDDGTAPNSILVPAANAHQITALGTGEWQEDYTWEDAMDILNLSRKHQEALASLEGQREKGKGWRLSVSDLREKACSFISLGELVARLDKPVPTVTSLVRHKGLGARGLFGWDRKTTEAELSELLL